MDDNINTPEQSRDDKASLPNTGSVRISFYSWFMILFLCLIWPISIVVFFNPPSSPEIIRQADPILRFYLPTIGLQLAVLLLVFLVCRKEGSGFGNLGFDKFKVMHIFLAIAFIIISSFLLKGIVLILEQFDLLKFLSPARLLPRTLTQKAFWIILCVIVAFTEETAYRGYLITRLSKISRSTVVAVIIATLGFGAGHLYQGTGGAILLFFYGLMFALLYLGSRSLWPCVIAHFLHNAMAPFILEKMLPPGG
jgi:membrane protease YdiL (CAAX protease family)